MPYPEAYRPNPTSRRYVQKLDSWYAQSHPDEDFAETFALFVHTRILGKPYAVVLRDDKQVIGIYSSCLQTGNCPAKADFVKRLLASAG